MIDVRHVALALVFLLSACAVEKAQESPIVIRGQLISAATKKPLSGYLVEVADANYKWNPFGIPGPKMLGSGKSDANGHFTVTIFGVAEYRKAEKGGKLALYLGGIGPVAGSESIVGIVGLKAGKSPVYLVPSLPYSPPRYQ